MMTLSETLIAGAGIGVALVVVALGVATVRSDIKRRQTEQLLAKLDEALSAYHTATGQWPMAGRIAEGHRVSAGRDPIADRLVAGLAEVPLARQVLDTIDPLLWVKSPSQNPCGTGFQPVGFQGFGMGSKPTPGVSPTTQPSAWGQVQDAWGRPLACLTADSSSAADREAVAANGGRPVFVSAGPDEQFGTRDIAAEADDIRSDMR